MSSVQRGQSSTSALGPLAAPVYSTVALAAAAAAAGLALWRTHLATKEAAAQKALNLAALVLAEEEAAQELARRAAEEVPCDFAAALARCFGETLQLDEWALSLTAVLHGQGFTRGNTLATLSLPRDPLMAPFREQLQKLWGENDTLCVSSLSGLPLLGVTGLRAACSGARQRPRTVIIASAHMAVAADGTVGECDVLGEPAEDGHPPAHACTGLLAFRHELQTGQVDVQPDPSDLEYWLLKQALLPRVTFGAEVPTLEELVQLAAGAIADEVEELVNSVLLAEGGDRSRTGASSALGLDPDETLSGSDVAVFVGVALHGPEHPRNERVWPVQFYSSVGGVVVRTHAYTHHGLWYQGHL